MDSSYRDFIQQLPGSTTVFLTIGNEQKDAEVQNSGKFQVDAVSHEIVIFKKEKLQEFFDFFKNVPRKVVWDDKNVKISGNGPYDLEMSGLFMISPPANFISRIWAEKYLVQFRLFAKIPSVEFFR